MNIIVKESYLGGKNKAVIHLKFIATLLITYSHMGAYSLDTEAWLLEEP